MLCFRAVEVSSCFSGPSAVFLTLQGQDAPSSVVFALLSSFFCVFIGSKLLSKISLLCPVRGFASLIRTGSALISLILSYILAAASISCSWFLAVSAGFKLPYSSPWVRPKRSPNVHHSQPFLLLPHPAVTQRACFWALAAGRWQAVTQSQRCTGSMDAWHGPWQGTPAASSPSLRHHPSSCTQVYGRPIWVGPILSRTIH